MQTYSSVVKKAIQPALTDYRNAREAHGHDYGSQRCRCGWAPRRPGASWRRAVGLHIAAADKRADKAYEAASGLALDRFHALEVMSTQRLVELYAKPDYEPIRLGARPDKMHPEVRRLIWLVLDGRGARLSSEATS